MCHTETIMNTYTISYIIHISKEICAMYAFTVLVDYY